MIGAAGFIGSALVGRLHRMGVAVASFSRQQPFVLADGALDQRVSTARSVFWLASSIRPATAAADPRQAAADTNSLRDLIGLLERDGPPRLVAVSSGGTVYDPAERPPYREDSPLRPVNDYGEAMRQVEQLVHSVPGGTVLRVSNAYGPGQPARRGQGVIAHWLRAVAAGQPVHLAGDAGVARDYVYISDVVDALVMTDRAPGPPPTLNVGSGVPVTLAELSDAVRRVVSPHPVTVVREPSRAFDAPSTWLDVSLAESAIGWRPATTLDEGLRRTWEWLQREGRQ